MAKNQIMNDSIVNVEVSCVSPDAASIGADTRDAIVEAPLTIEIKDLGAYTIMSTPCDKLALAVGFCYSEGIIDGPNDIATCVQCPDDPNVIRIQLIGMKSSEAPKRNLLIVSSCGVCGSEDIAAVLESIPAVPNTLTVDREQLVAGPEKLRPLQKLFRQTGAAHAAALMRDGELSAVCEDIGRHSAFDKTIGTCLLRSIPMAGATAVLSGRVSLELVIKAARAGIEVIAAVSAPTSLAIEAAEKSGITLCGFVRDGQATIYCHRRRIQ